MLACLVVLLIACTTLRAWTIGTFASAEGRFSVIVPGSTMKAGTLPSGGPFAAAPIQTFVTTRSGGPRFAVLYADADPTYLAGTTVDAALQASGQANIAALRGTPIAERALIVAGQPGREDEFSAGSVTYIFRTAFVGNRLYSISVDGPAAQVHGPDAQIFLDSFAVTS
jgi:hypothetical protein